MSSAGLPRQTSIPILMTPCSRQTPQFFLWVLWVGSAGPGRRRSSGPFASVLGSFRLSVLWAWASAVPGPFASAERIRHSLLVQWPDCNLRSLGSYEVCVFLSCPCLLGEKALKPNSKVALELGASHGWLDKHWFVWFRPSADTHTSCLTIRTFFEAARLN